MGRKIHRQGRRARQSPSRGGQFIGSHRIWRLLGFEPLEARCLLSGAGLVEATVPRWPATVFPQSLADTRPSAAVAELGSGAYLLPGAFITSPSGALTTASSDTPLNVALAYLRARPELFGVTVADIGTPTVTDNYTDADSGITYLYLEQNYKGLEIANADVNFSIDSAGRILAAGGAFTRLPVTSSGPVPTRELPTLGPIDALHLAGQALGLVSTVATNVLSNALVPGTAAILSNSQLSLDPIPAQLQYVVTGSGLQLVWDLVMRTPDGDHWYDSVVDASSGSALWANDWVDHATYNVFPQPIESPADGSRTVVTDPADPLASPFGWHDTNGVVGAEFTDTRGNNVSAQDDIDHNNTGGFRPDGGAGLNFDFPIDLTQSPSAYQSAAITNLFYWNNLLHDIHNAYGFTEAAGNFQVTNYSGAGLGNDAVQADAQDGAGNNNANFASPPDGQAPRMQMFIWTLDFPSRDGDFDSQIITHEYGHGVSNRLTGGPANANALGATQSGGMGEGWSDWWAEMLTLKPTDTKLGRYPMSNWVINQPETGPGLRRFPYSFDMSVNPLTVDAYGSSGTTSYGVVRSTEVHNTGEIWCSALWDMAWLLIDKYGVSADYTHGYDAANPLRSGGNNLALKLVMDALKLQPANPSFTQARDAILQADQNLTGGANRFQIWTAFARRGLGFSASTASSSSNAIAAAFDLPPELLKPRVESYTPNDVSVAPVTHVDFTFNRAMDTSSFSVADDVVSFTGPGNVDLRSSITGFTWLDSKTLRVSFDPTIADGMHTLVIGPDILDTDGDAMDQDADTVTGTIADRFTATFRHDSTRMQVASTAPADGSTVLLPFTTIDVNLNEAYDPASVGIEDLAVSQGAVTGFSLIDADTIRFTLAGLIEGPLNLSIDAGALLDFDGNPSVSYSGSINLSDAATVALPLTSINPAGGLVYGATASSDISFVGDVDGYTIDVQAGQTVTVVIDPEITLRPTIDLRGPSGLGIGTATAGAPGGTALIQTIAVSTTGTYTVNVGSTANTTGKYTLQVLLNAAVESELHSGPTNNSRATAQDINGSFVSLGGGIQRGAVLGDISPTLPVEIEPNGHTFEANDASKNFFPAADGMYQLGLKGSISAGTDVDFYKIGALQAGDVISISASGSSSLRGTLQDIYVELYRGSTTSPTIVTHGQTGSDSLIFHFAITTNDTYYVKVRAPGTHATGSYDLAIWLDNAGLAPTTGGTVVTEVESNNTAATANDLSTSWRAVQYVSQTIGSGIRLDHDIYRFEATAGDLVSVYVHSQSTLNARTALNNPSGTLIAFNDGADPALGLDAALYAFLISTTGTYYFQADTGSSTGSGQYAVYAYLSTNSPPPIVVPDYYAFDLAAGESVSLVAAREGGGGFQLRLEDAAGTIVAQGTTGATNYETGIHRFVAPVSGTYYAVITNGTTAAPYNLVVTRGADFDREENDTLAAAQNISGTSGVLGYLSDDDYYSIPVTAGQTLHLKTATPGGGPLNFVNVLDPRIELYDPSGALVASDDNSADGRNAELSFVATTTGNYRVRVASASGAGEYTLASAAVTNQWKGPAGGDWSDPNNWTGHLVPDSDSGEAGIVRLWNNLANDGLVNLGSITRNLRLLSLQNTTASYTVDSTGGSLIVRSSSGDAQIVFTPANTQNHTISASLQLGSSTQIDAHQETLTLSGLLNWNGKSITVTAGTVQFASTAPGQNTDGATLTINPGATVVLSGSDSLSDGTHYVDVTNNGTLIITEPTTQADLVSEQSNPQSLVAETSSAAVPVAHEDLIEAVPSLSFSIPSQAALAGTPQQDLIVARDLHLAALGQSKGLRDDAWISWPAVSPTEWLTRAELASEESSDAAAPLNQRSAVEVGYALVSHPYSLRLGRTVDPTTADEIFQWYGTELNRDE